MTFRLDPGLNGYATARTRDLFDRIEETLVTQPGVTSVSAASVAVVAGDSWGNSVMVEGFEAGPDTNRNSRVNRIGTDYFRTLEIPLLSGREFVESDILETSKVAIVNESFARKFGLGRDVVDRRMGEGGLDAELDLTIVGLVRDATYNDVKNPKQVLFFTPYRQAETVGGMTFCARTSLPPDGLVRSVPALVGELDPNLPVDNLKTLPQQVRENLFLDRMVSILSAAFAVLATLLAAVGLYGVLAYTVAQRTREIGLRMALGATPSRMRYMVLGQVGRMMLVGGTVGIVVSLGLGRVARSLLYEIESTDPFVVGAALLALGAVALAAGFVPARRASRTNPMTALRYE